MIIKQFFPVLMLILCIPSIAHLQTDSLKFSNRKYKREIGIDMTGIFAGNPGSSLIFKIRNDRGKLIALTYAKNYRFAVNFSGNLNLNSKYYGEEKERLVDSVDVEYQYSYFNFLLGIERVNFYNKINFYYGCDAGLFNQNSLNSNSYYYYQNNVLNYLRSDEKSNSLGAILIPFFGLKYKLNERFSLSLESGASVRYAHIMTKYKQGRYIEDVEGLVKKTVSNRLFIDFIPLRFLTFNYHFKQY
jgi:hypothetical protein